MSIKIRRIIRNAGKIEVYAVRGRKWTLLWVEG